MFLWERFILAQINVRCSDRDFVYKVAEEWHHPWLKRLLTGFARTSDFNGPRKPTEVHPLIQEINAELPITQPALQLTYKIFGSCPPMQPFDPAKMLTVSPLSLEYSVDFNPFYMLHHHFRIVMVEISARDTGLTYQTDFFYDVLLQDSGKLQTLDILLKRLRAQNHRVLLFAQMTKMLNILEVNLMRLFW